MANCSKCGSSYNPGEAFCGTCGAPLQNGQASNQSTPYTSNYQLTYVSNTSGDNFVKLSEDEVKLKTYHCTKLKRPNGEGYVTVTNKRVVFHGYGTSLTGYSKLVSEVPIETVSGVRTYFGTGIDIPSLIFAIIFSIPCLFLIFNDDFGIFARYSSKATWIPFLIFLALAIFFFMRCRQGSYYLSIFSNGANGSPISIGDGSFGSRLTGQGALMTVVATPAEDTQMLMQEIGAIIIDLKTMGDYAIQKWAPNVAEKRNNNSQSTRSQQSQNTRLNDNDEEFFK